MIISARQNFNDIYKAVLASAAARGAVVDVQRLSPSDRFDHPTLYPTHALIEIRVGDGDLKLVSITIENGEVRIGEWDTDDLKLYGFATRSGEYLFANSTCKSAEELAEKVVADVLMKD